MASLRKKNIIYSLILAAAIAAVWFFRKQNDPAKDLESAVTLSGTTFGVVPYNIKYIPEDEVDISPQHLQAGADSILSGLNQSLSTYIDNSEITEFNEDNLHKYESQYFYPVLAESKTVFQRTRGAFDPTVGPLVDAWGFGPGKKREPEKVNVDSLLGLVGYDSIFFDSVSVCKLKKGMRLDFSAIAKGYGVDLVASYLTGKGLNNIFVEIGGELACRGVNDRGEPWVIGIDNPTGEEETRGLTGIVRLRDQAMATSGNYRQYYEKDGKRYSHTISPVTGLPVTHSLLSASVFSPSCMTADAYATAFMVMGLKEARDLAESEQNLEAYFIYSDSTGALQTYATPGIRESIETLEDGE
ncbi:FAD:protein FMN transferase [Roseivirga sp. BDSF3-8]|uniref:FAD:protein FMN transferase n=1 Tax=Roseivirga sp. BDSF3-8 TaxID=3241598 RepID=UPI0035321A95